MSGTKASTQQRTNKKAADFILRQRHKAGGPYAQGWNAACETLASRILAGEHTKPPAPADGTCGVNGCIHQAGHVELGQGLHSNGVTTWRDRKR